MATATFSKRNWRNDGRFSPVVARRIFRPRTSRELHQQHCGRRKYAQPAGHDSSGAPAHSCERNEPHRNSHRQHQFRAELAETRLPGFHNFRYCFVEVYSVRHFLYFFGGVISFSLNDDTEDAATKFVTTTRYFKLAESLGGVKSLICHPSQMTHKSVPREKRLLSGINDSLIRISCGIEDAVDLIADLEQAFKKTISLNSITLNN